MASVRERAPTQSGPDGPQARRRRVPVAKEGLGPSVVCGASAGRLALRADLASVHESADNGARRPWTALSVRLSVRVPRACAYGGHGRPDGRTRTNARVMSRCYYTVIWATGGLPAYGGTVGSRLVHRFCTESALPAHWSRAECLMESTEGKGGASR